MVKCHVRTFHQDLSVTCDKSQISARQVPSVTRDRRIDWNPTVLWQIPSPPLHPIHHSGFAKRHRQNQHHLPPINTHPSSRCIPHSPVGPCCSELTSLASSMSLQTPVIDDSIKIESHNAYPSLSRPVICPPNNFKTGHYFDKFLPCHHTQYIIRALPSVTAKIDTTSPVNTHQQVHTSLPHRTMLLGVDIPSLLCVAADTSDRQQRRDWVSQCYPSLSSSTWFRHHEIVDVCLHPTFEVVVSFCTLIIYLISFCIALGLSITEYTGSWQLAANSCNILSSSLHIPTY